MAEMIEGKIAGVNSFVEAFQETSLEADSRKAADFPKIEHALGQRYPRSEMGLVDKATSLLGTINPFAKEANPEEEIVWVLDNTAYRPLDDEGPPKKPWQAEFVACFFHKGRGEISKSVSEIADIIGLDGKQGADQEARKRIEQRIQPFVSAIAPSRSIQIQIPSPSASGSSHIQKLGPSNPNGISSQVMHTGGDDSADGKTIICTTVNNKFPDIQTKTRFAGVTGWGIISDIDDTIKITQTPNPVGTLRSTFADIPKTTPGMPEFYQLLHQQFGDAVWFYLSASPYNLYPFLHEFIGSHYPPGTIVLRDASWMYFGGLLQSFTQGVKAYKTSRINKIHHWLPRRNFICIGDSTQSDPEAYAQMYHDHPGWIKAIFIRKVTDAPYMENKNKDERFKSAFRGVPDSIWKLFTDPADLNEHVKELAGQS